MSKNTSSNTSSKSNEWRSAVDAKSGRTYYYNIKTKETTWSKPLQLASPAEQQEMIRKKEETLKFFREMEDNIRNKIHRASEGVDEKISYYDSLDDFAPVRPERTKSITVARRIRTISTIDDEILYTMKNTDQRHRTASISPLYVADSKLSKNNSVLSQYKNDRKDTKDDSILSTENSKNASLKRRNSTGRIFVGTTMSTQDNKATIECVCVVIRAHMIEAARESIVVLSKYDVFKDEAFKTQEAKMDRKEDGRARDPITMVPSLATVRDFFMLIFSKSQLENDCIIMALIYCERLVKETKGHLSIRYDNWKSIVFACLVMASKVWDDLSMWNVDFSHVCPSFDLHRVNTLELAMLDALKYIIRVSASEYAKYYFHLRSMMSRLGLHENEANWITPLDVAGARKLQLSTEKYQLTATLTPRRVKSTAYEMSDMSLIRMRSDGGSSYLEASHHLIGLEELIHSEHMDADGQIHLNKNHSASSSSRDLFNYNKSKSTSPNNNNKNNNNNIIAESKKDFK
eukprot:gene11696-15659_t